MPAAAVFGSLAGRGRPSDKQQLFYKRDDFKPPSGQDEARLHQLLSTTIGGGTPKRHVADWNWNQECGNCSLVVLDILKTKHWLIT